MRTRLWTLVVLAVLSLVPSPITARQTEPDGDATRELAAAEAIPENASAEARLAGHALIDAQRRLPGAREVTHEAGSARETADAAAWEALRQAESDFQTAEQAQAELEDLLDEHVAAQQRTESHKDAGYEEAKRASERVAGQLRDTSASPGGDAEEFLMPVSGWKSSDYGMRFDPVYQVEQLHAGVDFAAASGEPIHAVASGEVVEAGQHGGYGNYTCVSHGEDLSTCYGHQSKILVSQGDKVARGDTIGEVGTTGASTGDHLHFEVRRDGDPVEPLEWLPRCLC